VPFLSPAIAHLRPGPATDDDVASPEPVKDPDLTICLWDSASTGVELTPLLAWLCQESGWRPFEYLSPRRELTMISNERVPVAYDHGPEILNMLDTEENVAIYWIKDALDVPYHENWKGGFWQIVNGFGLSRF